jgi:hypothetical protein
MIERAMCGPRTLRGFGAWPAAVVALALLAGCAPRAVRLAPEDLAALSATPAVTIARARPPAFAVESPGNTAIGSVSGVSGGAIVFAGRGAGSRPIEDEYGLDDPAIAVRDKVVAALAFEAGVKAAPTEALVPPEERADAVLAAAGREGWALDVTTVQWGLAADPKLWTRYRVTLEARGRIIDLAKGRVAWQAVCDGTDLDAPIGSTIPELTARDGEALKKRLAAAADRCGEALVDQLFSGMR